MTLRCAASIGSAHAQHRRHRPSGGCRCGAVRYTVPDAFEYGAISVVRGGDYVQVAMGSLIDAPTRRPDHHIFVGSKAAWDEIRDGLPEFEAHAH